MVALEHPVTGYKRLTWHLQNDFRAGLRSHEVYAALLEDELLRRRGPTLPVDARRPEEPAAPNQVWHIDLMYVWLRTRWFYLVDIIDAYSRYLVHWTLNPTLGADHVTMTVLEALERWNPAVKPIIVHDHGTQFTSKEWRVFVEQNSLRSIFTKLAHPESNGRVERVHRTHRTEGLEGSSDWNLDKFNMQFSRWVQNYNNDRPHSSLRGLPPVVYYLGEPDAAIAQREHFVREAAAARTIYWQQETEKTESLQS